MKMKKWVRSRVVCLLIGAALILLLFVLVSCGNKNAEKVNAASGTGEQKEQEDASGEKKAESHITEDKSETVYVKADPEGKAREITVEAVLKCEEDGAEILDISDLSEIKNTKGDEEYRQQADGTVIWENHGEDIHYKGKSSRELPVTVKISYSLNGELIAPEDLAGKSGKVSIRFEYENHTQETVSVEEKEETAPVPFLAMSALLLPEEVFSNIEVTNGKLISMDGQSVAVGYAYPGLAEYLKLDSYEPTEDVELPDYVEITADAAEFELAFTATVITSGSLEDFDAEDLDDIEELTDSMDEMSDGMDEVLNGIGELLDGAEEFQDYLNQFADGASALKEGMKALKDGTEALNTNKEALAQGAQGLQPGLETLNTALKAVELPGSAGADAKPETGNVGMEAGSAGLETGGDGAETAAAAAGAVPSLDEMQNSLNTALLQAGQQAGEAAVQAALAENPDLSEESQEAIRQAVAESLGQNIELQTGIQTIQAYAKGLSDTMAGISGMGETLTTLKTSVAALAEGSKQLSEGITAFNEGIGQLYEGSVKLYDGTKELSSAGDELADGFGEVTDGVRSLQEGMEEFDEEGISELEKLAGDDLKALVTRLKALKETDDSYTNFSGIREGKTGSVKFILETDEIEK